MHSTSSFLQSVDFGICSIALTYHRSKIVDFTFIIDVEELAFISRGPIVKSRKWIFLEPFLFKLWLALLMSTVAILAILRCLSRDSTTFIATKLYQILLYRGKLHCGIFPTQSAYGCLTTATDMTWKQTFSIRLIYGCWMFVAIVLTTAYSCSFYSMLTLSEFEPLADTMDDLIRLAKIDRSRIYLYRTNSLFRKVNPDSGPLYTLSLHLNR